MAYLKFRLKGAGLIGDGGLLERRLNREGCITELLR